MGKEAMRRQVVGQGYGYIDVSLALIASVLRSGWSTGSKNWTCSTPIPDDAELYSAETRGSVVRLHFRGRTLPPLGPGGAVQALEVSHSTYDVRQITAKELATWMRARVQVLRASRRTFRGFFQWLQLGALARELEMMALVVERIGRTPFVPPPPPQPEEGKLDHD